MIRGIVAIVILDLKRFWMDRARLIAGLIQPLLYLFVLGAGIGATRTALKKPICRSKTMVIAANVAEKSSDSPIVPGKMNRR